MGGRPFAIVVAFEDETRQRFVLAHNVDRGWELPGGHVEDDESPIEAARREFREEICHELATLEPLLVQDIERGPCHVFAGRVGDRVRDPDDYAIDSWRYVDTLDDVDELAFPDDPYIEIERALDVDLRDRRVPFAPRDVDEVLEMIENRRRALVEGCQGWLAWLSDGGGRLEVTSYLFGAPQTRVPNAWTSITPVPRAEQHYRPQGLAYVDGDLWLTDHHENRKSHLYRLDPATGEVLMDLSMPDEARHPGGLAEDGNALWALDYVSAKLYEVDLQATIDEEQVVVDRADPTGLDAASALDFVEADGRRFLAFSDFLWRNYTLPPVPDGTGHTFLVPANRLDELGRRNVPDVAEVAYDNGGYPQGLAHLDGYVLEAVNYHQRDWIWVLDADEAVRESDPSLVRGVGAIPGPDNMIEDLATDGTKLWTSDESTYELYEHDADLARTIAQRVKGPGA